MDEIDRLLEHKVQFGDVLADAGYGSCGEFRAELSARNILWTVGILSTQKVYPTSVRITEAKRKSARGPRPTHKAPSVPAQSVEQVIAQLGPNAIRTITWRRVNSAAVAGGYPQTGAVKYYATNDTESTEAALRTIVEIVNGI